MIKFFYSLGPNPRKVALLLEEAGVPYKPIPVDTRKGEQHRPEFLAINPNAKVPAIVDDDGTRIFDCSAILLYLAEKCGRFLPPRAMLGDERTAQELSNVDRLLAAVDARPATQRALALKDRYRFKSEMDAQSWNAMFPHMKSASTPIDSAVSAGAAFASSR